MIDEAKLKQVMSSVLGVPADTIDETTSTDTVADWTSLAHLNLIVALEEEFDVMLPDDEVADLTSYPLLKLVVAEQVAA
jgi:acyl carrier protein